MFKKNTSQIVLLTHLLPPPPLPPTGTTPTRWWGRWSHTPAQTQERLGLSVMHKHLLGVLQVFLIVDHACPFHNFIGIHSDTYIYIQIHSFKY